MLARRTFLLGSFLSPLASQQAQDRKAQDQKAQDQKAQDQKAQEMFADAEAYQRFMGRWSRLAAPLLSDFAALPEQGRVLDIGSGTGSLSFAIAERQARLHVLGIDPSKEYIAYASSKNPFPGRVTFDAGDAQRLQLPDASFDAALSLFVFNFIPDPKKALAEIRRVTKPGGSISAAVWDYGAGMTMLRIFWDAATHLDPQAEKLDEKHMPLSHAGELSTLWKHAGLEHIQENPIDIMTGFNSFSDFWDPFLLGQGPAGSYVKKLHPEKQQALRSELRTRLALPADNTQFDLPARLWAVRGIVP